MLLKSLILQDLGTASRTDLLPPEVSFLLIRVLLLWERGEVRPRAAARCAPAGALAGRSSRRAKFLLLRDGRRLTRMPCNHADDDTGNDQGHPTLRGLHPQ